MMPRQIWKTLVISCLLGIILTTFIYLYHGRRIKNIVRSYRNPKPRIFCFIPIQERNLLTKGSVVKKTWLSKCDGHMFFGPRNDPWWPMVKLPVRESFQKLPAKTKAAFKYIHKHFQDSYDYFLKADDDTYVIVENLRYLLMSYNDYKDQPIYIGHKVDRHVEQGYLSGGASYVLNRVALNKLVKEGFESDKIVECMKDVGAEDATIGRCLEKIGVKVANSLDCDKRDSFHPFNLQTYITGNFPTWYKSSLRKEININNCCSPYSVSFHFIDHTQMEIYHYLIYNVEVYGKQAGIPQRSMYKAYFNR